MTTMTPASRPSAPTPVGPLPIALVGVGKIARDQHVPALAADPAFELVATVDPHAALEGVPAFPSLGQLLAEGPAVAAVAICTPPGPRCQIACEALAAGKAVMLEKPPGATVSEVGRLVALAQAKNLTLFAAWHSRCAPAVEPARAWAHGRRPKRVEIVWREDVRRWHPGQDWIFEAGGLGVFDPGINALSIATQVLPPFFVVRAELAIPENRGAPIAARIDFNLEGGGAMSADLDFLQTGPQTWDIRIEAEDGARLALSLGGGALAIDGAAVEVGETHEYPALYKRFAQLVAAGASDVDVRPLQQVADAFMLGARVAAPAFDF